MLVLFAIVPRQETELNQDERVGFTRCAAPLSVKIGHFGQNWPKYPKIPDFGQNGQKPENTPKIDEKGVQARARGFKFDRFSQKICL